MHTIPGVEIELALTDADRDALRARAEADRITVDQVATDAVREYLAGGEDRGDIVRAATLIMSTHADALRWLAE